jgi:hypothetical protein
MEPPALVPLSASSTPTSLPERPEDTEEVSLVAFNLLDGLSLLRF